MTSASLNNLPQHVAIIMDGNGRWAKEHNLPRLAGHNKGATTAEQIVSTFREYEIPYLTLYAFSTENWNRPKTEINGLFQLLNKSLNKGIKVAQEKGIKIHHLGKLDGLPPKVQDSIKKAQELTQNNNIMTLNLAFNYGSRDEIVEAIKSLIRHGISAQDINENIINQYLYTIDIPDPDLIIRTGGEMRLSNFLTWQAAYAEIYFTSVLWPNFDKKELDKAITSYIQRQRRFGGLSTE